jgi:hypothetical protein
VLLQKGTLELVLVQVQDWALGRVHLQTRLQAVEKAKAVKQKEKATGYLPVAFRWCLIFPAVPINIRACELPTE